MQPLDAFMSRLMPQVRGCPAPLAEQALVDAAIEFCEETGVVRATTDPIPLIAGQATYDVDTPSGTEIVRVIRAWSGKRLLALAPAAAASSVYPFATSVGSDAPPTGDPVTLLVTDRQTVTLYPTPDKAVEKLTLRVATRPQRGATRLEDALLYDWAEAVVSGALFRLASTSGQAFSDAALAQAAFARFWFFVNRARIEANRARVSGPVAVAGRPLA